MAPFCSSSFFALFAFFARDFFFFSLRLRVSARDRLYCASIQATIRASKADNGIAPSESR
jgi:hypothetical protein